MMGGDDLDEATWDDAASGDEAPITKDGAKAKKKGAASKKGGLHDEDRTKAHAKLSKKDTTKGTKRPAEEPRDDDDTDSGADAGYAVDAGNGDDERTLLRQAKKQAKLEKLKAKKRQKRDGATAGDDSSIAAANCRGHAETDGEDFAASAAGDAAPKRSAPAPMASLPATAGMQATYLWQAICRILVGSIADIERRRPWLQERHLAVVDGFGQHTVPKLPGYIKAAMPEWSTMIRRADGAARGGAAAGPKLEPRGGGNGGSNGGGGSAGVGPAVIILCSGALRSVEVIKGLSSAFRCPILKLFARHLKLADQQKQLEMARRGRGGKGKSGGGGGGGGGGDGANGGPVRPFPIAVGTPGRVAALAKLGALAADETVLVVLDMHRDIKGRCLLDMADVSLETARFLQDWIAPALVAANAGNGAPGGKGGGSSPVAKLRIALY